MPKGQGHFNFPLFPRVAFHALQSRWYPIGWLAILALGWTVTALLLVVLIGFVLIPVMAVVAVVPFARTSPSGDWGG